MIATVYIDWAERLTNSTSGNPRYRVHFTNGGNAKTAADSAVSYSIHNFTHHPDRPVVFTFDSKGQITDGRQLTADELAGLQRVQDALNTEDGE
jgi:hypothetical protein